MTLWTVRFSSLDVRLKDVEPVAGQLLLTVGKVLLDEE